MLLLTTTILPGTLGLLYVLDRRSGSRRYRSMPK